MCKGLTDMASRPSTAKKPQTAIHHGRIPISPVYGTISILLLQPRPKARQQTAWPFLAAAKCSRERPLPAGAANAFYTGVFETEFILLTATDARSGLQRDLSSGFYDTNGLTKAHVSKANRSDSGSLPILDGRV
jgi:hypothetical protein